MGRPAIPMVSGVISCLVNIVLNALLIYGLFHFPRWGVIGAAAATMIARFLEAAYLFYASRKYLPTLKLRLKNNLPSSMRWTVIRKALPLMGNELIWSLGLNMIFINYSFIAEQYIPAITVVDNISNLVYVAFSGCSVAVGVIIGQALGSGKLDQAKQDAKKMIGFALTVYLAGGLILVAIHRWRPALVLAESGECFDGGGFNSGEGISGLDAGLREHGLLYSAAGRRHEVGADHRRPVYLVWPGCAELSCRAGIPGFVVSRLLHRRRRGFSQSLPGYGFSEKRQLAEKLNGQFVRKNSG